MKLNEFVIKDAEDTIDQYNDSSGAAALTASLFSPGKGKGIFVHLCCIVPEDMAQPLLDAATKAANAMIEKRFGKAVLEKLDVNIPSRKEDVN